MRIRAPVLTDAESLAAVQCASWSAGYADILPLEVLTKMNARRVQQWTDFLTATPNERKSLVCELDGQIAGLGFFGPSRDEDDDKQSVAELYSLYIHPDFWRRGCGRALCGAVLARTREMEFR